MAELIVGALTLVGVVVGAVTVELARGVPRGEVSLPVVADLSLPTLNEIHEEHR